MEKEIVIRCNEIYTEKGIINGYVTIKDKKITNISTKCKDEQNVLDYKEYRLLPGIIDVHSHGFRSFSAKTIDPKEIQGLSSILPSIGVTATLLTTTGWRENEYEMLEALSCAMDEGSLGAKLLGIHMEGPFFNPLKHNATSLEEVQKPVITQCEAYWRASHGKIKYMTIAPEVEGALEAIRFFKEKGVIIGAGHTLATNTDFIEAKKAGVSVSIHTGNAMQQIDRREIGLMGAALLDRDVYCEVICDLFHLSKEMLEIMFRIKSDLSKMIMISDSDTLSGVEPGTYFAYGKRVHVKEDGRVLLDDGMIAGSSKYVLYGIQNLVEKMGYPLSDIVKMFSLNPAMLLGIESITGSIAVGKDADFMILNDDYEVQATYIQGKCCYRKGDEIPFNADFSKICQRIDE